ncbi:TRAP transporter permease [Bilophila wadsworthia]|uniref:TRAP transporter permease n=1 Tax=Bilophila wadsworthia TaxID=35833 RepID=UPI0026DBEA20|nr:TRAP transporter fused permease subunit [Bilophila wadsworthia]
MNEMPLHEPLIAEEGKEKERVFTGTPERIVNICLASISALIIYWTVYVSADVMWKHGLYIMTVFCMTLVIYPFEKKPKVNHVSLVDWLLIIGSIAGSAYAIWEYLDRFMRLGMLTEMDIFFGCLMLFLGLEVGRRVIGWSLTLVSIVLILYSLYGFVIPGHFGHGGFDLEAVVTQVYAGMEGYYGLSAKMMIQYVAPFILMGAFLEKSGAGDFFIRLAFALTRNTVGGPAKAAVIGSALLASISGSAVANVSSTGVLTIPMMKKVGYRPHVAGAIEAAASTGGQIMPPIMGAVAFLMAEFTQIPYLTIVTVATGPIILYYITLMAFIHFEAKKHNIGQMKDHHIPSARTVCSEGWHFFVAIMVIIVIMAFGYSPGMSALGGIITLIVIHSIKSRKVDFKMLYEAMVLGGPYSLGIGSLVGCIGIILSLVGLTGVGLKLSWLFTTLANGSPLVAILLVGLISMILGMGLASGPAYIVTAIAVGPALADMGFPLMTAHFIMMWFSIDSEITPPVGLASIVGAGIANADPMKTMFTAFNYAKALYILPILFYYRPALLLQSSLFDIALTFVTVMLGLIAFAAVWENYLMRRTTLLERILLLGGALLLFIPGHIWDFAGIGLFIIVYCLQRYYCPAGFRQTA